MQIYLQRWNYLLDPSNLVSWALYATATAMVIPIFSEDENLKWLSVPSAALTIFLSWFNLLLYLQRLVFHIGRYLFIYIYNYLNSYNNNCYTSVPSPPPFSSLGIFIF